MICHHRSCGARAFVAAAALSFGWCAGCASTSPGGPVAPGQRTAAVPPTAAEAPRCPESATASGTASKAPKSIVALERDIAAVNQSMKALSKKLDTAAEMLGRKQFPKNLGPELDSIRVAPNLNSLDGQLVGSLPPHAIKAFLVYAAGLFGLETSKNKLSNLLPIAAPVVEAAWKEETAPVVKLSVVFRQEPSGTAAYVTPMKDPFPFTGPWPATYAVLTPEPTAHGMKVTEKSAVRWTRGGLTGPGMIAIPIHPESVAAFTGGEVALKLRKALWDIRTMLEGDTTNPDSPEPGLLEQGEALVATLRQLSRVEPDGQ